MCSPQECAALKTRIDALDAEMDNVLLGKRARKVTYGQRSIETGEVQLSDLRQRKGELERRYLACNCSPALTEAATETGRRSIRPLMR